MAQLEHEPLHIGVSELSRFGRSFTHPLDCLEKVEEAGGQFNCLNKSAVRIGGSPTDKLVLRILSSVGAFERELIAERTKDGLKVAGKKVAKEGAG